MLFFFWMCWQQFLLLCAFFLPLAPLTSNAESLSHICFGEVAHQSGGTLWSMMVHSHFSKCVLDVWWALMGLLQAGSDPSSSDRKMLLSKCIQHTCILYTLAKSVFYSLLSTCIVTGWNAVPDAATDPPKYHRLFRREGRHLCLHLPSCQLPSVYLCLFSESGYVFSTRT